MDNASQFPLPAERYGLAISWDESRPPVDVDLQAIVVGENGSIIDAVYYNNMKALKGLVTHSGDELSGRKGGFDEEVWCNLSQLPPNVKMIIFVVATHTGHLKDVQNGMIHLLEANRDNKIYAMEMERSEEEVDLVAAMIRSGGGGYSNSEGGWQFEVVHEPAQDGRHFIDILEPTIGNFVRARMKAPRRIKVAFAMEKGAVLDLPRSSELGVIKACLGWDAASEDVDLDVSAVCFDVSGNVKDTCFFGQMQVPGLKHSGDNLTGEGDGDDEIIECNLNEMPTEIKQVIFVVNIYTKGTTFDKVANAYCRVVNDQGDEMAKFVLTEGASQSGLLIARLYREVDGRFGFQALGCFAPGQMWKDSVPAMIAIANTDLSGRPGS